MILTTRQRWEYLEKEIGGLEELNALGVEGWELIQIWVRDTAGAGARYQVILKRSLSWRLQVKRG